VFDHVTIRVSSRDASRRFYETVLAPLGHAISYSATISTSGTTSGWLRHAKTVR
jgi:catechol 2,3-dioxygenase-like lactoylglutathione lyase family enzyme